MTTNPNSLAIEYADDGTVKRLICETCVEWTGIDFLYRDENGDVWDICRWCGTGEPRPHDSIEQILEAEGTVYSDWSPTGADALDDISITRLRELLIDVEVWMGARDDAEPRFNWVTFDLSLSVGQVPCHECGGTGWWGFVDYVASSPCVDCKGTGREWVGLW